jgi:hypothetical protein
MSSVSYTWHDGVDRSARFVRVEGTRGTPYSFGTDGGEASASWRCRTSSLPPPR